MTGVGGEALALASNGENSPYRESLNHRSRRA